MKILCIAALLTLSALCSAQDADTYLKVEKARAEVPDCKKLLESSSALGSIPLLVTPYSKLDTIANVLTHCGFVFRITGDILRADQAGDVADRYDSAIAQQMQQYLKAKGLWEDFIKQDCRMGSSSCGKK